MKYEVLTLLLLRDHSGCKRPSPKCPEQAASNGHDIGPTVAQARVSIGRQSFEIIMKEKVPLSQEVVCFLDA